MPVEAQDVVGVGHRVEDGSALDVAEADAGLVVEAVEVAPLQQPLAPQADDVGLLGLVEGLENKKKFSPRLAPVERGQVAKGRRPELVDRVGLHRVRSDQPAQAVFVTVGDDPCLALRDHARRGENRAR